MIISKDATRFSIFVLSRGQQPNTVNTLTITGKLAPASLYRLFGFRQTSVNFIAITSLSQRRHLGNHQRVCAVEASRGIRINIQHKCTSSEVRYRQRE
jgi:hypothetical protein